MGRWETIKGALSGSALELALALEREEWHGGDIEKLLSALKTRMTMLETGLRNRARYGLRGWQEGDPLGRIIMQRALSDAKEIAAQHESFLQRVG